MGKRKIGFRKPKSGVGKLKNAIDSDDEAEGRINENNLRFGFDDNDEDQLESMLDDEIDKFNSERQEQSRTSNKKKGNDKKKRGRGGLDQNSDEEEQEIYGLDVSSDEEDDDEAMPGEDDDDDSEMESDEELIKGDSKGLDGVPDSKAWGKKARSFHNTDYIDQDFGGFEGADAELAQQEEDEAREIQKRLTAELDEADFEDFLPTATGTDSAADKAKSSKQGTKEFIPLDLGSISLAEQLKLIERECPEVVHFLKEYKDKLDLALETRDAMSEDGKITDESKLLNDFHMTKYLCILNYCVNISYFLYLRSTNPTFCKGHPVIKAILQYKRLLDELNQFKPITSSAAGKVREISIPSDSPIPLKKLKTKIITKKRELEEQEFETELLNKIKAAPGIEQEESEVAMEEAGNEKRSITYEMAKNKGLMPKRKKEQRNPRVKHREKYRKAKIRRKGQVRNTRTEVKKYDGEAFGIKSNVTKSIKLK